MLAKREEQLTKKKAAKMVRRKVANMLTGSCFGNWKERILQMIVNECSIKRDRFALIVVEVEL
jgi:hypothetical protein